ncbi:MAG TPA: glycogen synthase [Synergistales bacterium]|nr:glycogen synthase [Synergistales bacterium]HRV71676.1 glycogen synthase [Thermovirgaceae bacterium]
MQTDTPLGSRISVLHVTPEMAPLSKIGGLADVAGSLPSALRENGVDARVITPAWPGVMRRLAELGCPVDPGKPSVCVPLQWRAWCGSLSSTVVNGVPVYLLEHPLLFENPSIYPAMLDKVSALPFAFLSLAALEPVFPDEWKPDIIHVHDWASCIIPAALKWHRYYSLLAKKPATLLTIHNLAHQGSLPIDVLEEWGMGPGAYGLDGLEYFGEANLLKGGITSADLITTVSPSYAGEILTPAFGEGLEGVLKYRKEKIKGVLNGLDTISWDPLRDPALPARFGQGNMRGKKNCKNALLERCGWEASEGAVMVSVGRLVRQKGMDLVLECLDRILEGGGHLAVIGTGELVLEKAFSEAAATRPDRVFFLPGFDEGLARLAYAGGDIFLMPSLFEPCGLSQMIAMRYGTVPVARKTGGLADTISDVDEQPGGTGFLFGESNPDALADAVARARARFSSPRQWSAVRKRCMEGDFSWKSSARAYVNLYRSLVLEGSAIKREG